MTMDNPVGRVNYEPNSGSAESTPPGPREAPDAGFTSFPEQVAARSAECGPSGSPITTARLVSSTSARPRSSSATS